mmetsp:Transcript_9109/g.27042  ORF Transcript_9109/g.27042 Transcript_9109/m.27042 type:complete len:505 (+) Transcript_9109:155-1669(+)
MLDCREAVCNGDRRPLVLRHDTVQRRLHHPLPGRIQRRRRLVQQQHRRLANDGASNRHPLLLAARKHASAETHLRGVAVGKAVHHKAVRVRRPRRLLDLVLRGALLAVANVLGDGALEEHRLLPHQPKVGAEPAQVERADVDTVEGDRAALRVVEALEQRHERRLARPRGAAQGDPLARLDLERVPVADEVVGGPGVGKDHIAHRDLAADLRDLPTAVDRGVDARLAREGAEDQLGRRVAPWRLLRDDTGGAHAHRHEEHDDDWHEELLHQRPDLGVEAAGLVVGRHQRRAARGRLGLEDQLQDLASQLLDVGLHEEASDVRDDADHSDGRPLADAHGKGGEDGILLRLACLGVGVRLVLAKEAGLGTVRGDRADGLHDGGDQRAYVNPPLVRRPDAERHHDHHPEHRRHHGHDGEHHDRQLPVAKRKDEPAAEEDARDLPDRIGKHVAVERLHERNLLPQEGGERARRVLRVVEEANLLPEQRADDDSAQPAGEVLAGGAEKA